MCFLLLSLLLTLIAYALVVHHFHLHTEDVKWLNGEYVLFWYACKKLEILINFGLRQSICSSLLMGMVGGKD